MKYEGKLLGMDVKADLTGVIAHVEARAGAATKFTIESDLLAEAQAATASLAEGNVLRRLVDGLAGLSGQRAPQVAAADLPVGEKVPDFRAPDFRA